MPPLTIPFWRVPGRIAYIVSHSYPYSSNGYAVRTHGVATGLRHHGHSVIVINRPGQPWDISGLNGPDLPYHQDIDGVRYLYLREPSKHRHSPEAWSTAAAEALQATLRLFKPSVVMAASNWENAQPALQAARALSLPFFYEVRGFWEITRASREPEWAGSAEYAHAVEQETAIAQQAERVFTLNRLMRDELVRRGVRAERIELVPNGVGELPDLSRPPQFSRVALGINSRYVVGYVGSFNPYEGLDDLIRACSQLVRAGLDLSLLLVGSGSAYGVLNGACAESQGYRELAQSLGLGERLMLPGRVPADQVADYYRLIDLVVMPRKSLPVTELVSPIKPLEAAAHGKAVLVSDVAPLKLFAEESGAVLFRKGDRSAMANQIRSLISDEDRRQQMGQQQRLWVSEQQLFTQVVKPIQSRIHALATSGQLIHASPSRKDYSGLSLSEIRVAVVMDEFTYAAYKDTCVLVQLSIDNWEAELNQLQPDLLFIESAWRGKDDAWNRKINIASPELLGALSWCKERSIPAMFWNKEDPVHYGTFLNTAKRFDFIFTTDLNCIGNYKRDLGHERVFLLPFGCNPIDHNPIEKYTRKPKACFAGSYYVRYPERIRDLDILLETFIEHSGVDIYDRNHGKEDVNYAFPDKYKSLILGNLKYDEIDIAYKGYEYGINLNSVKYSPTMFARRVFELLASRTVVASNYSQGVRLFFGDLVISSDAKSEVKAKVKKIDTDSHYAEQLKLAGLRKVMTEHTYEQRFSYITEKVLGRPRQDVLPLINVLVIAKTQDELDRAIEAYQKQFLYARKKLIALAASPGLKVPGEYSATITLRETIAINSQSFNLPAGEFATFFSLANDYGEHYLTDLAIATKYTKAGIIAKGSFDQEARPAIGAEYSYADRFYPDAALVSGKYVTELFCAIGNVNATSSQAVKVEGSPVFITDHHNFRPAKVVGQSRSQPHLDTGVSINTILRHAEATPPAKTLQVKMEVQELLQGNQLHKLLNIVSAERRGIVCTVHETGLKIEIAADAESPYYIYTNNIHPLTEFWKNLSGKLFLDTTPGLELAPVVRFFDADKNQLNHVISISNWNQQIVIPNNAKYCRLGIRVAGGPGQAIVKNWVFDHASQEHRFNWIPSSKTLLISANYPHYDDYYRYAFVHRRVKGYKYLGHKTDVFRFRQSEDLKFYEFESIDVVSGGQDILNTVLQFSQYSTIAIHALDRLIWDVVSKVIDKTKIIIWLHGAEIQSWKRRMFNYTNQQEIDRARGNGEMRDAFWQSVFKLNHPNIHFVFVSNYLKEEVLTDLGITYNPVNIHIIHNPIDTDLFKFVKKDPAQRKKILSIRPYASRVYANDLMVKAIIELSSRPYFNELQFKIVGDGILFDETVEPLKQFKNVILMKGFLSQLEIAKLHREYGVFLCPSRMDTQGVSRDEAMASGLVSITNAVGAIPEFIDSTSGFVCEQENYRQLSDCIDQMYHSPDLFIKLSANAASTVREKRSSEIICPREIQLIRGGLQ